jgi:DNA polymerase III delta subunit
VVRDAKAQGRKSSDIVTLLNEFNKKVIRGKGNFSLWQVERFEKQARAWSRNKFFRAFDTLALTDAMLKSSRIDKKLVLEHLILQLA